MTRRPLLDTAENDHRNHDGYEEPQDVIDTGPVREDRQHSGRFRSMKKVLKVLVVVAVIGLIAKLVMDNA